MLIEDIKIFEHRVEVIIASDYREFFNEDFWYECPNVDLNSIPKSLLIIPFILNIAPVIWACGLKVSIPLIDATLKDALPRLKFAYQKVYPSIRWSGEIEAEEVTASPIQKNSTDKVALLFSGGVDSINLSQDHLQQSQILLTIRGADVKLNDDPGWFEVKKFVNSYAGEINAIAMTIESNFATFINYQLLNKQFFFISDWWGMVQHGIGLAGFLVIPARFYSPSNLKMASDLSSQQMIGLSWSSVSDIMNNLTLPLSQFSHASTELTRQDKINKIASSHALNKRTIPVRVCYAAKGGKNCGLCRKCLLAMVGFSVSGQDYRQFGFATSHAQFASLVKNDLFTYKYHISEIAKVLWLDTQNHILPKSDYERLGLSPMIIDVLMWLQFVNIEKISKKTMRFYNTKHAIKYLIRQIPFSQKLIEVAKKALMH